MQSEQWEQWPEDEWAEEGEQWEIPEHDLYTVPESEELYAEPEANGARSYSDALRGMQP